MYFNLTPKPQHINEWQSSQITDSLVSNNLQNPSEEQIAEYLFGNLPSKARRNDGRISTGYLKQYANPLKGGWAVAGYNPTDFSQEPEIRSFKPDIPRTGKDGKPIKYDTPKNSKHYPIFPRIPYSLASKIFRAAGLGIFELGKKYQDSLSLEIAASDQECVWFWQAVLDNPIIPITITEGAKKQLSLLSQAKCAIAVTSITTWRAGKGSKEVHPWLALYAKKRRCYIAFDQDTKEKTVRAVNGQIFKLGYALTKAGAFGVKRISWYGTAKGIDDFINVLFHKGGNSYVTSVLSKCYENARSYRSFKEKTLPGKIHKVNKQYISSDDLGEAKRCRILIVKSAKGTGKTSLAEDLVDSDLRERIPTINLSHLERLARELGQRLSLPYRTEEGSEGIRAAIGYSLCIDSFHPKNSVPFNYPQWRDTSLVIDEFTQVLQHLAFGNTELREYRELIKTTLGHKLADCWQNNKQIRLLDADASPEAIELVYELIQLYCWQSPSKEELESGTAVLINEYKQPLGKLFVDNSDSPLNLRLRLKKKLANQENLLILTSSQKAKSGEGTINLEALSKQYYKPEEVLRIDSKTVTNPLHPAFGITGQKLTQMLKSPDNKIKIVIASPTICTGISIDNLEGFFSAVFSFQAGNISANSVRQQLSRLRDWECPRYVWCPKTGNSWIRAKSTNPIELIKDEKHKGKAVSQMIGAREAEKLIESGDCPLLKYWAVVGANRNRENWAYRDSVIEGLEKEGWDIEYLPDDIDDKALKSESSKRKSLKEALNATENNFIADSPDIDSKLAKRLESSREKTDSQSAMLQKYNLKEKYGTAEVKPELVEADKNKLYPKLRLRFFLGLGREFVERSDRSTLESMKEKNNGKFFIPDFNSRANTAKVKVLEQIESHLDKFTGKDTQWSNKSPELIEFKALMVNRMSDVIRLVFGLNITEKQSPIVILQKLLALIGKGLKQVEQIRDKDSPSGRLRIYGKCCSTSGLKDDEENAILNYWLAKERSKHGTSEQDNLSLAS